MALVLNDNVGGSRSDKTPMVYDPKTDTWSPQSSSTTTNNNSSGTDKKTPSSDTSTTKSTGSKKKAEKEYIEAEFNILTGELQVAPTKKSIKIKVNDTIKIEGLGNYLSGLYFVSSIKRTIDKDSGYSHTFTLIRNGFGSSVKKGKEDTKKDDNSKPREPEVEKTAPEFKVGDSVKIVGADAIYSNASEGVKVPEWVKKKTLTIQQISSDGARVLLNPILSWTYVKYIQKV